MTFDNTSIGLMVFYGVGALFLITFLLLYVASKKR